MSSLDRLRELDLPGDRGRRVADNLSLGAYLAFGEAIKHYQRTHPDTIVRTVQTFSRSARTGSITVTWWPRGAR